MILHDFAAADHVTTEIEVRLTPDQLWLLAMDEMKSGE